SPASWQMAYACMALFMLLALVFTRNIAEPGDRRAESISTIACPPSILILHFLFMVVVFVGVFSGYKVFFVLPDFDVSQGTKGLLGFIYEAVRLLLSLLTAIGMGWLSSRQWLVTRQAFERIYISPFADFFVRYGRLSLWLLLIICFYRVSDIVMGIMAKVFYTDMGYSKEVIGRISFGFGLIVSLIGGILGGALALRWGILRMLLIGALLSAVSNLAFVFLASVTEPSVIALGIAIVFDNLAGGLAAAVGVAFLSVLVNRQFGASQYAAFTSVTLLLPKLIAGYSGQIVDAINYPAFFIFTAVIGMPVILLILKVWKPLKDLKSGF
nr:hypothetical protein [Cellvibrionaceae bacterium]